MADSVENKDAVGDIREWRSIITLIVFVVTNIVVLFPFKVTIFIPHILVDGFLSLLRAVRILPAKRRQRQDDGHFFLRLKFPLNTVTAPLIADLFLLAILAIGRQEVSDGTIGADNINPLDIMVFFITLAYIAISIDASGLIRYLAFKVLQWGGRVGHRLFFFLYSFFFVLGSFIGNDPIILSGTAFLAYMTRVSSNIVHPRAWIYSQFAVANIASAILVSSNPTNLVLAGAFHIKFVEYTASMIVPVVITAIFLFPFLLYIVFANEALIPISIKIAELPEEARQKKPVNPNIPHARGTEEGEEDQLDDRGKLLSLEEIMNPFLDKGGAIFGAAIMAATLVTILVMNATKSTEDEEEVESDGMSVIKERPAFLATVPAAIVMLLWDLGFGWLNRHETRDIARRGRQDLERARAERAVREREDESLEQEKTAFSKTGSALDHVRPLQPLPPATDSNREQKDTPGSGDEIMSTVLTADSRGSSDGERARRLETEIGREMERRRVPKETTLVSLTTDAYRWASETFPTAVAVLSELPYALIPFAFSMFILVQALVTKGWVQVFAQGWDNWVNKTGNIGAVGGMGFLSVCLCNFSGTNIGTTILLSRVIQAWQKIHKLDGNPISERKFWATVYSMALGVNYGAFSTALSASLAGLLWRDILAKKHIHIRRLDFARVNLPIIAIAMTVGCTALIAEVYIKWRETPYLAK
ncbi:arsenite efflux transporter ArsB-like protein [Podospora conica]|nr:arsenite efflux transporter ArsB-like protein [Schizothecium conicum]